MSVRNVILGNDEGGVTLWAIYLFFVGRNVQESGGVARGFPKTAYWSDGQAA